MPLAAQSRQRDDGGVRHGQHRDGKRPALARLQQQAKGSQPPDAATFASVVFAKSLGLTHEH
jgi:hypothetical protein